MPRSAAPSSNPLFLVSPLLLAAALLTAPGGPRSSASAATLPAGSELDAAYAPWLAEPYAPDELLVQFRAGSNPTDRARSVRDEHATLAKEITPDGLVKVRLAPGDRVDAAVERWSRRPEVEYATVNLRAHAFFIPNDSLIQITLEGTKEHWAWNLARVDAYSAWDVQTGDPRVILAIIDSGVAYEDHEVPDYEKANLWPGVTMYRRSPEMSGPFLPGWDFIHDDPYADDDYGHGTQVATIAAGQANNIAGSAGIAYGVSIMPIKVLDFQGDSDISYFVQGIRFAADHGANVANMSFGFPPLGFFRYVLNTPENVLAHMFQPLRDAVFYAQARGVILVGAAGNFDAPEVSLPAGYPGVIAVGATRPDDYRAAYSSYGRDLDFVAPGGDFTDLDADGLQDQTFNLSIKPDRSAGSRAKPDSFGVFPFSGTSAASPHVAGAVALLLSRGFGNQGAIEQALRSTAKIPAGPSVGSNLEYGHGLIQIGAALRARLPQGRDLRSLAGSGSDTEFAARLLSASPTGGSAALSFRLAREGRVRVRVFDARGALVRTVEDRIAPAGDMRVEWNGARADGARVSAGIYFFRVETPDGVGTRKVAIIR